MLHEKLKKKKRNVKRDVGIKGKGGEREGENGKGWNIIILEICL